MSTTVLANQLYQQQPPNLETADNSLLSYVDKGQSAQIQNLFTSAKNKHQNSGSLHQKSTKRTLNIDSRIDLSTGANQSPLKRPVLSKNPSVSTI